MSITLQQNAEKRRIIKRITRKITNEVRNFCKFC